MLLVDTTIWIDHLRHEDPVLTDLLNQARVLCHPLVIGEVAMGQIKIRRQFMETLAELPQSSLANDDETLRAIERYALFGTGLSYVDACLLTSAKLTPHRSIWTRDKRMKVAAHSMSIAVDSLH